MQKHTKIYLSFFGHTISCWIKCEIENCFKQAVDIHHIDARKMGGNPSGDKDVIENLMGLCREHHEFYGDKKEHKQYLFDTHKKNMENFKNVSRSIMQ